MWLADALFLEEVLERASSVFRPLGPRRCLAFHRDAQRKEPALVAGALVRDALRDRLGTLKPLAWSKVSALLTGVELCSALGALAERTGQCGEDRPAVSATADGSRGKHGWRTRPGGLYRLSLCLMGVVTIPMLAIFSLPHGGHSDGWLQSTPGDCLLSLTGEDAGGHGVESVGENCGPEDNVQGNLTQASRWRGINREGVAGDHGSYDALSVAKPDRQ